MDLGIILIRDFNENVKNLCQGQGQNLKNVLT